MQILHIDPSLKSLILPLSEEEYQELERNIIDNGCRDAIVVWWTKDGQETLNNTTQDKLKDIIVDGHIRYEICKKHDLKFSIYPMWFETMDEAQTWVIKNQFARRNIDKVVRAFWL